MMMASLAATVFISSCKKDKGDGNILSQKGQIV